MNKDIHIFYMGGHGGHLCAHLILESQRHFCKFRELPAANSVTEFQTQFKFVKQQQWNIDQPNKWKDHEFWPANNATRDLTIHGLDKLFLTCNPFEIPDNKNEIRLLIYTDFFTQMDIAKFKRCGTFFNVSNVNEYCYNICRQRWDDSYRDVKDTSWPDCTLDNIDHLPATISNELKNLHSGFELFFQWADTRDSFKTFVQFMLQDSTTDLNGIIVDKSVADIAKNMDYVVYLQDILCSQGKILLDIAGLPWHNEHASLIAKWLSLHSEELQKKLLVDN